MTSSHPLSALSSALLSLANEQSLTAAPLFDAALAEMAGEEKKETTDAAAAEGGKAGSRATAEEVARVRLARAANSLRLGRYTDALADCDAALGALGDVAGVGGVAHLRRGRCLFLLNRFDEALLAFQAAEEREGKDSSPQPPSGEPQSAAAALWVRKCGAEIARSSQHSQRTIAGAAATTANSTGAANSSSSTPSSSPSPPAAAATLSSKVSMSWFQSRTHVTLTLFAKNLAKDAASASLDPSDPRTLQATLRMPDGSTYERRWQLFDDVDPSSLRVDLSPYRVELQLKKAREGEWVSLEAAEQQKVAGVLPRANVIPEPVVGAAATPSPATAYPTSSKRRVEWNEVEQQAKKMEEEEKPTGDAALQKLFQSIYKDASEDTRRAMVKSFQTSGGTVLSTNWDEVRKTDYEKSREPPTGSEFRSWNNP